MIRSLSLEAGASHLRSLLWILHSRMKLHARSTVNNKTENKLDSVKSMDHGTPGSNSKWCSVM